MKIIHIKGRNSIGGHEIEMLCAAQISLGHEVKVYPKHLGLTSYLFNRMIMRRPDVINLHGTYISWKIYKRFLGFIDKVKVVQIKYKACDDVNQKDRRKNTKYKPKNIQALVFPSSVIKESYGKNIAVDNIHIIPQGNDIDISNKYDHHQLSITKEIIGYGGIILGSRIHTLIESIRYLPKDYSIRWVGNGVADENYLREITDLAKNIGVENRVEIILPQEEGIDTNTLFYGASLFIDISDSVLPSYLIESLIRAIPVVSSKEILSEVGGYNYVCSLAPKSIANTVKNTIENNQIIDKYEVLNEFSWDACAKRYDIVYANLVKLKENK